MKGEIGAKCQILFQIWKYESIVMGDDDGWWIDVRWNVNIFEDFDCRGVHLAYCSREMKEKEQGKFRSARQPQSWNRTWKWTAGLLRFLVDFFSSLSLLEQTKHSHRQSCAWYDASHATNRHTNRKLSCLWKPLSSFLHFIRSIFGSTSAVSLLKFPRLRLDWHLRHYE